MFFNEFTISTFAVTQVLDTQTSTLLVFEGYMDKSPFSWTHHGKIVWEQRSKDHGEKLDSVFYILYLLATIVVYPLLALFSCTTASSFPFRVLDGKMIVNRSRMADRTSNPRLHVYSPQSELICTGFKVSI